VPSSCPSMYSSMLDSDLTRMSWPGRNGNPVGEPLIWLMRMGVLSTFVPSQHTIDRSINGVGAYECCSVARLCILS
jgi:hypothetical protein